MRHIGYVNRQCGDHIHNKSLKNTQKKISITEEKTSYLSHDEHEIVLLGYQAKLFILSNKKYV